MTIQTKLAQEYEKNVKTGKISITVAREVVGHLSFRIYKNFARAIRELVSNSYDAGATEVRIGLDLKSTPTKVVKRDNGVGMIKGDMERRLFRIGNITKPFDEIDELGRRRVGQFGIGFLSLSLLLIVDI